MFASIVHFVFFFRDFLFYFLSLFCWSKSYLPFSIFFFSFGTICFAVWASVCVCMCSGKSSSNWTIPYNPHMTYTNCTFYPCLFYALFSAVCCYFSFDRHQNDRPYQTYTNRICFLTLFRTQWTWRGKKRARNFRIKINAQISVRGKGNKQQHQQAQDCRAYRIKDLHLFR